MSEREAEDLERVGYGHHRWSYYCTNAEKADGSELGGIKGPVGQEGG